MICRSVIGISCSNQVQSVRNVQYLMYLFLCSRPDVGSDIAGLPTIPGAMLLTILQKFGLEDVFDILVNPKSSTSSQFKLMSGFCAGQGMIVISFCC